MEDDGEIGFEEQLAQENREKLAREDEEAATRGLTYTDTDGTVMEWDPVKRAYFPKIDTDFIAQYQMNYGTGLDPASSKQKPTGDSSAGPDKSSAQAWYNYYNQQAGANKSGEQGQQNYTAADYHAYYSYYYGEDYMEHYQNQQHGEDDHEEDENEVEEAKDKAAGKKGKDTKKGKDQDVKRKALPPQEPAWFDMDTEKSTHVYVSNLPTDLSEEEFKELMSKCGLIMFDPLTHKPKLKLYRNPDGSLKGDGLCCYIKQESVDLALKILDGCDVRAKTISVERAKFQMKGEFDPTKKKKKLSNKAKRKLKEKQEKLFDWRPDTAPGTRFRFERIVILKNMFDVKEFEGEPELINELREDVRTECSKFGEVRKVQVYDHHAEGVISVIFKTPEEGDTCVAALNGRWFAKRQISAATYDGKTKYEVKETEAEKQERLRGWEKFLGDDSGSSGAANKDAQQTAGQRQENSGQKVTDSANSDSSLVASAEVGASSAGDNISRLDSQSVENVLASSTDSEGGAANSLSHSTV